MFFFFFSCSKTPVGADVRAKQNKLKATLQTAIKEFETVAQEHRRKEREIVVNLEERYSQKYGSPPDLSGMGGSSYAAPGQLQVDMDSQQLDDVDLAIIQDRNRDMQQLDRDMEQLAEVYQDVNRMVNVQGEQIDYSAGQVEVAENNSAQASQSLKKGAVLMSAYRKKVVIIVIIIIVVVLIIGKFCRGFACCCCCCEKE